MVRIQNGLDWLDAVSLCVSNLRGLLSLPLLSLLIFGTEISAQTVPGAVEPGRVEKRFEQPVEPKSTLDPIVPEMEGPMLPGQAKAVQFVLSGIHIDGSTVYTKEDLLPQYQSFLTKEISLQTIYNIAGAITEKYGNDGYTLSRAYVPPQKINGGIVRISIIEGFVDNIVVEGAVKDKRGLFDEYKAKILASKPLNSKLLERYLLLANDLSGVKVTSVFKPSETTKQASTLVMQVEEKAFDIGVALDNRGTESSGPYQITVNGSANNIFGLFGHTSLQVARAHQPKELKFINLSHDFSISSEGTKLSLSGTHSRTQPGTALLQALALETASDSATIEVSHPFIRTQDKNLSVYGGFTVRNSKSEQLSVLSTEDHLRVVSLGANYDFSDEWRGINQINGEIRRGLSAFGATSNSSVTKTRSDGRYDFLSVSLDVSRSQKLKDNLSLFSAATAQWAADPLMASEECGLGGEQYGRAYDSSEIIGDHCVAGSLELRYLANTGVPDINYLQLYAFYDLGAIWNKNPPPGTNAKATLASTGVGTRFGIGEYVTGSLELTKPLTRDVAAEGNKDPRLFFHLSARY